ncbi:MAG: 50S ribosomal protein L29 [Candidatus Paceibacterota bacterium]
MADFTKKTDKELEKLLEEKREALREQRFSLTSASGEDVRDMRESKKDIARILTELRSRDLA